ncbi:energy-coupling factor transporter transmembrane component T [Neobacillus niacini]|uniref:energy-coupling factor transporter transmembrane component T family protein n=1 Tax=Neobacillus niacini TaxID=86668 RepID=UPI00052F6603|nr:energy-coupling factor transporter transmembrane component T [Neobacillus niacini]KGM45668.1 thiamine permease [Neobacillus niacini]MEC1525161.1 energy-coupling factor transporter transmembrane component T [Neobacillus niacini]
MSLHEVNPSIKAFTIVISILILSAFFDPITPILIILWTVTLTFVFGRVSLKKWLLLLAPFLFIAVIYVWSTLLFPRLQEGDHVIWQWGFLTMTAEGFRRGVSLGLRVLSFATLSIMFTLTTKPTDFLLSLMQQCKLPPKLAYGIMAGYRFLPLIKEEFQILQNAHRVRGVARARTISEKMQQLKRYVIPLLAGAIRKAERTALAMESKGFTGEKNRIFYREIKLSYIDWLFFILMISAVVLSVCISWKFGYLQFYNGEL